VESKPRATATGSPESYIKLTKISLGLQEFQIAAAACEKGLSRFPGHAGLLVARGQTFALAYNVGRNADHLKNALESFEGALKINPHNYVAKILAGQIYLQLQKYDRAAERFTSILRIDPSDTKAQALLKRVQRKLDAREEKRNAMQAGPSEARPNLAGKQSPEEEGVPSGDRQGGLWESIEADASANHDFLVSRMRIFSKMEGLLGLHLTDKNGDILKSQKISKLDPALVSSMAGNVFRSTDRLADKFKSGAFLYSMVMCQNTFLYIVKARWAVLVLEIVPNANQEIIENTIQKFLGELDL